MDYIGKNLKLLSAVDVGLSLKYRHNLPERFLGHLLMVAQKSRRKTARFFLGGPDDYVQIPGPMRTDLLVSLRPEDVLLPDELASFDDPLPRRGHENELLVLTQNPLVGVLKVFRLGVLVGRSFLAFSPHFRTIKPFNIRGEFSMKFLTAVWPTATIRRHSIVLPGKKRPGRATQEEIALAGDYPLGPYGLRTQPPLCMECGHPADTASGFRCFSCQERNGCIECGTDHISTDG